MIRALHKTEPRLIRLQSEPYPTHILVVTVRLKTFVFYKEVELISRVREGDLIRFKRVWESILSKGADSFANRHH